MQTGKMELCIPCSVLGSGSHVLLVMANVHRSAYLNRKALLLLVGGCATINHLGKQQSELGAQAAMQGSPQANHCQ
jgi:hypothetical protein